MPKKPHIPSVLKKAAENTLTKPATSKYPFEKAQIDEKFRGQPILNEDQCIGCGLCCRNCPSKAIDMQEVNGKKYPEFDLSKCVFCYQCIETCPKKAITSSTKFELATTDKSTLIVKPK